MKRSISLLAVLTVVGATVATAQINYSGGTYSENFNTISILTAPGRLYPARESCWAPRRNPHFDYLASRKSSGTGTGTFALFADWGGSTASTLEDFILTACPLRPSGRWAPSHQPPPRLGSAPGSSIIRRILSTSVTFSFDREIWRTQNTAIDRKPRILLWIGVQRNWDRGISSPAAS